MTKQEKKFRELFNSEDIQEQMKRLDRAGVPAVQRATSIMALRRIHERLAYVRDYSEMMRLVVDRIKYHVTEVIRDEGIAAREQKVDKTWHHSTI